MASDEKAHCAAYAHDHENGDDDRDGPLKIPTKGKKTPLVPSSHFMWRIEGFFMIRYGTFGATHHER